MNAPPMNAMKMRNRGRVVNKIDEDVSGLVKNTLKAADVPTLVIHRDFENMSGNRSAAHRRGRAET